LSERTCSLPVSTLLESPFSLDYGDSVIARIVATNALGDSVASADGSNTVLMTNPDPATNLREDLSARSASTLGFEWDDGVNDGGVPILSYTVS